MREEKGLSTILSFRQKKVCKEHDLSRELTTCPDLRRLTRTAEQVAELLPWPVINILFYIYSQLPSR